MKKVLFISIIIITSLHVIAQNDIELCFKDIINSKNSYQSVLNFYTKFNNLDSINQNEGLIFLSNFKNDSLLYNHFHEVNLLINLYSRSKYGYIRQKAISLFLDLYKFDTGILDKNFKLSDYDSNIKTHIIDLIKNPYLSKEDKDFLNRINFEEQKKYISQNIDFYERFRVDKYQPNDKFCDSLNNVLSKEYLANLDKKIINTDYLLKLSSQLNVREAIPYIVNSTLENKLLLLAKLDTLRYQDTMIEEILKQKEIDYSKLAFIGSKKSILAMIEGLRINETVKYELGGFDKNGKWKTQTIESPKLKLVNLSNLIFGNYLNISPPFEFDFELLFNHKVDEILCEKVAKWMEDNIDILQINTNFKLF